MSQRISPQPSPYPIQPPAPIALVLFAALLINLYGLYAFTGLAILTIAFIVVTAILASLAVPNTLEETSGNEAAQVFLFLTWGSALVTGATVGLFHWFAFKRPALITLGLFAICILIWIFGRSISALWAISLTLFTFAMAYGVLVLPAPPGSLDMEKKENQTLVVVQVRDGAGRPVYAAVYADLKWYWRSDPPLDDDDRQWWSKTYAYPTDGAGGLATLNLQDDPRFKILVVRVRPEPRQSETVEARVEYEDARAERVVPGPGTVQPFNFVLKERRR